MLSEVKKKIFYFRLLRLEPRALTKYAKILPLFFKKHFEVKRLNLAQGYRSGTKRVASEIVIGDQHGIRKR